LTGATGSVWIEAEPSTTVRETDLIVLVVFCSKAYWFYVYKAWINHRKYILSECPRGLGFFLLAAREYQHKT
jgi:hypothetical protein